MTQICLVPKNATPTVVQIARGGYLCSNLFVPQEGGMGLIVISAERLTLFLARGWRRCNGVESVTAKWVAA